MANYSMKPGLITGAATGAALLAGMTPDHLSPGPNMVAGAVVGGVVGAGMALYRMGAEKQSRQDIFHESHKTARQTSQV
jgi:hypothetical protein